jgi:hypothetical protein
VVFQSCREDLNYAEAEFLEVTGTKFLILMYFFGPKWHSPIGSMPFHRAQPPPFALVMDPARIKSITQGAV